MYVGKVMSDVMSDVDTFFFFEDSSGNFNNCFSRDTLDNQF